MTKLLYLITNKSVYNIRKNTFLKMVFIVFPLIVLLVYMALSTYSENINKGLSQNLIRLHVIANSDSIEDQALKLNVRDAIIGFMEGKLDDSKSINQTKAILNNNMSEILRVAKEEVLKNGADYEVKTMVGIYPFPTKEYGDVALPAGNYQALRVVIGEGAGANWWCVLFPPLCFVDATHGVVPDYVKSDLKQNLTDEEYKIITSTDENDIPVRIRFKTMELYQNSKIKFSGMLGRLFR